MKLVDGILSGWQRIVCHHRWVRARWEDGSYGLRCARCMTAYPRTWDDIVAGDAARTPTAAAARLRHAA